MAYYHDGKEDFPHGAGPSEEGWYHYLDEPIGPFNSQEGAITAGRMQTPKREYPNARMDEVMRNVVNHCYVDWGTRPRVVLACQGAADEHWQVFHPRNMEDPVFTIDKDNIAYQHARHFSK